MEKELKKLLTEEMKYEKPWQPYVSFGWDSPSFEFRLAYPQKDFGNELLQSLRELGYKVKVY